MCAHACNSLPSTLGDGDIAALQPEEAACGPFFYPAMVGTPAGRAQRSQDRSSPASRSSPGNQALTPPRHLLRPWWPALPGELQSPWSLASGRFAPGMFLGSLGFPSCWPHSGPSGAARLASWLEPKGNWVQSCAPPGFSSIRWGLFDSCLTVSLRGARWLPRSCWRKVQSLMGI